MNGHEKLITDLEELLSNANLFLFHDFKSEHSATPKILLVTTLNQIVTNAKLGKYDNEPEEYADDLNDTYDQYGDDEDCLCEDDFKND